MTVPTSFAANLQQQALTDQALAIAGALVAVLDEDVMLPTPATALVANLRTTLAALDLDGASRNLLAGEGGPASLSLPGPGDGHVNGAVMTAPEGPPPHRSLPGDLAVTTVESHSLTIEPNGDVRCSCTFSASADAFGRRWAVQLVHAHIARPDLSTADLLAFVTERAS